MVAPHYLTSPEGNRQRVNEKLRGATPTQKENASIFNHVNFRILNSLTDEPNPRLKSSRQVREPRVASTTGRQRLPPSVLVPQ
jgi:hypothetical protein